MLRTTRLLYLLLGIHPVSVLTEERRALGPVVLTTDVAIIGGGASGTYAAVRLREDLNTSILLIEPRDHLGGHTSTYFVPETNTTFDYGVQSYLPYGPALDFFARFGIQPQAFTSKRLMALNVDVKTGKVLPNYIAPSANATNEALQRWLSIVSKYQALLEPGYWNFPKPSAIPAEFLVPFDEFAKSNLLEAAVPRILTISGVGYGGIRELLTFEIFQAFGASLTKGKLPLYTSTVSDHTALFSCSITD
jgi:phytoene dehydrogenase-like protein